jgi:flagellin
LDSEGNLIHTKIIGTSQDDWVSDVAVNLPLDISTQSGANSAIGAIDSAIDSVNSTRSTIGSYINRLNYAGDNATNISTNLSASRSAIRDTDYAEESANLAKSQITQRAATAMLAQANLQPQNVLPLFKNL